MRYLSFKIQCNGVTTRLQRLPHRRVWEHKTRTKKRLNLNTSFSPPTHRIIIPIPDKAYESILVNTATDYKNKPLIHENSGLTYYVAKETNTGCGFLVADFDVLPPHFDSWEDLESTIRTRLDSLKIDGVFIRSATNKTKVLIPVIHDLPRLRHGAVHQRMACLAVLTGPDIAEYLDRAPAASRSAFFTREGAEAFGRQTVATLRGVSLAGLWKQARGEGSPSGGAPKSPTASISISTPQPVKRARRPARPNDLSRQAMSVAKGLWTVPPTSGGSPTGRPPLLRRRRATLAAILMLGGCASSSAVWSLSNRLAGKAIPARSFSAVLKDLIDYGFIVRGAKAIIKLRSAGLHLSPSTANHEKVIEFYRLMGGDIFPKDGAWNDYLFNITGLFLNQREFIRFVKRLPGVTGRPERLKKAQEAWASHIKRRIIREQKKAVIYPIATNIHHASGYHHETIQAHQTND